MALQFRKVLEVDRLTFTPVAGEPVYTFDEKKLYIGDGTTVGGVNIVSNITVQDFLDAELDEEDLVDGSFIYYDDEQNKWRIGLPSILTSDLDDVTEAQNIETDFMIVYDATTNKWIVQDQLPKALSDVIGIDIDENLTATSVLEYNNTTENFESKPLPNKPNIGDLLGVQINGTAKRGQLLFQDEITGEFSNQYIDNHTGTDYYANLFNYADKDIIKYNSTSGFFEKSTPFLKDIELVSLSGLNEAEPPEIIIPVKVVGDKFVFNDVQVAPQLQVSNNRITVFNLSDPSLLGKTFNFSEVPDGTHSLDPVGSILQRTSITITGTPGIDGTARLDFRTSGVILPPTEFYYFCPEEPEFGNKISRYDPPAPLPFVVQWQSSPETFNTHRFNYSLDNLGDVLVTADEDGTLANFQMLSWDAGLQKWTTPLDRVAGIGIGGELPRTRTQYSNAMWAGGVTGLGTFDFTLEQGTELKSIKINLDELEIEGQEEGFDAYFFETKEEREEFMEAVEEAERALGPGGVISRAVVDALAKEKNGKIARMLSNKKEYTRVGKSAIPKAVLEASGSGPPAGGGGGGGLGDFGGLMGGLGDLGGLGGGGGGGGGLPEGALEPGLDELTSPIPNPEEQAEEFKKNYKEFGNNVKKIFGAMMAKRRLLKELMPETLGGSGGGLNIEIETFDPTGASSQDKPPIMFGWRASTDIYGYYYFTYTQRASALTYNSRNHHLIVQSYMRRCACTVLRQNTFKVVYYYDADDSRFMAGQWLRIVEWQNPVSLYTGLLEELPSTTIRENLDEWDPGTIYRKESRVIHNDKVWECLVETSEASPPAAGTVLAPQLVNGELVSMFVEIPAFSVKSQLFEGVYQQRCTLGKDSFGGKTHPVFRFGEPGDEADYIYVGANLVKYNEPSQIRDTPNPVNITIQSKVNHRTNLSAGNYDIGVILYDINVHSALQHLMVGEFQTFNIEKRLGECNLGATQYQFQAESAFALSKGNSSGATQASTVPGAAPAGIVCYRGIFRPYGNQGYFIDGLNVNAVNGAASFNLDGNLHIDSSPQPPGYTFLENLPRPTLDAQGTGAAFISNFFTWRKTDYSDFVFYLPKSLGGGKDALLGDRIKYRNVPNTSSLVVPSVGSPFASPINQVLGENGPFNMNLQPLNGSQHVFGARYCVKRRGASLTPATQKTGEKELGTITDANGNVIASNVEQSAAQPGQTWTYDKTVDIVQVVPGNTRESGEAGTATTSLSRIVGSKSAVCIGLCDESDLLRHGVTAYDTWNNFRDEFPVRPHFILVPSEQQKIYTDPFPNSTLDYGSLAGVQNPTNSSNLNGVIVATIPPQGNGTGTVAVRYINTTSYKETGAIDIPDNKEIHIIRYPKGHHGGLWSLWSYEWRYEDNGSFVTGAIREMNNVGGQVAPVDIAYESADNSWASVAWSPVLSRYVAAGNLNYSNDFMYSPNGKGWTGITTSVPIAFGTANVNNGRNTSILWASHLNKFVVFGGVEVPGAYNFIATSSYGTEWSQASLTAAPQGAPGGSGPWTKPITCAAYSPQLQLIVALAPNTGSPYSALLSTNGATWTHAVIPDSSTLNWNAICWSPEKNLFVAVHDTANNLNTPVMTSPDGVNWTKRTVQLTNNCQFKSIVWAKEIGLFVAIGTYGNGGVDVITSPDGIDWTARSTNTYVQWKSIAYSPKLALLVAVNSQSNVNSIATSKDGITWTIVNGAATEGKWQSVIWNPDREEFLAVGAGGTGDRVQTSRDGQTWRTQTSVSYPPSGAFGTNIEWRHIPNPNNLTQYTLITPGAAPYIETYNPISVNQKSSLPLTYSWNAVASSGLTGYVPSWSTEATPFFKGNLVWIADPAFDNLGEPKRMLSLESEEITISYKIRIPAGIETLTQNLKLRAASDNEVTIQILNPITNVTNTIMTAIGFTTDTILNIPANMFETYFSPQQVHDQNKWLTLIVKSRNVPRPGQPLTQKWIENPSAFALSISANVFGTDYNIFNAKEWSNIRHLTYGQSLHNQVGNPWNRMIEAAKGIPSYGPYAVTRDNGSESNITDWFELCGLQTKPAGTIIGLFIDRSGSMTQSTVQASYSYFYQRCQQAGLIINEVQNGNEDWITPFIAEI